MSAEILAYQAAFLLLIVLSTVLFGKYGGLLSVAVAVIITVAMVFTRWLFIFQLLTIAVAAIIALVIHELDNFDDIRGGAWTLIAIGAFFGYSHLSNEINKYGKFDKYIPEVADDSSCSGIDYGYSNWTDSLIEFLRSDAKKLDESKRQADFKSKCDAHHAQKQALQNLISSGYNNCVSVLKQNVDAATLRVYPKIRFQTSKQDQIESEPTEGGWAIRLHATAVNGEAYLVCYIDRQGRFIKFSEDTHGNY